MNSLADSFVEGGVFMYPIALLGCLLPLASIGAAVVAIVSKTNRGVVLGAALLVSAILPAGLGVLAQQLSMSQAEQAIVHAHPADQATIRAAAMSESMTTTLWGYGSAVFPTFVGFALLGLGLSRLERFKS